MGSSGTDFSGSCHYGEVAVKEVKTRVNVWTVRRDTQKWPLWRGGRCKELGRPAMLANRVTFVLLAAEALK